MSESMRNTDRHFNNNIQYIYIFVKHCIVHSKVSVRFSRLIRLPDSLSFHFYARAFSYSLKKKYYIFFIVLSLLMNTQMFSSLDVDLKLKHFTQEKKNKGATNRL